MEEHLLSACLVFDTKFLKILYTFMWSVSLDLPKVFDRMRWPVLWVALRSQGVPDHLVWLLEKLHSNQCGQVFRRSGGNDLFNINAGVHQGCVLSPRLFCAVLQEAMRQWKRRVEQKESI